MKNKTKIVILITVFGLFTVACASCSKSGRKQLIKESVKNTDSSDTQMPVQTIETCTRIVVPSDLNFDNSTIAFQCDDIQEPINITLQTSDFKPKDSLTKDDIRKIADEYRLRDEISPNEHLSMLEGDISFFYEQSLSEKRLRDEFAAREIVLKAASRQNVIIKDQGVLSFLAQQIMADMRQSIINLQQTNI